MVQTYITPRIVATQPARLNNMALSRLSIKLYQLFRIISFLIFLSLSIRLVILLFFLNHKYFYLDVNHVMSLTLVGLNFLDLFISVFVFKLRNFNIFKLSKLSISLYNSYMMFSSSTNVIVFKNWYYYTMLLSYCVWQMYDNFNKIFKKAATKSIINIFIIRSCVLPLYLVSQLIVLVINMIHLNKISLNGADRYYYFSTIILITLYLPSLLYMIKRSRR